MAETPKIKDKITHAQMIEKTGRFLGMPRDRRRARAAELIEKVGLRDAGNKRLKAYSKGMLQRAGLAQALVNDPELVVLDEPMSGLDPIGRKEVRDLIFALRDAGKTVFFSTHILADVETIGDRIAILARGELRGVGTLTELVKDTLQRTDVSFALPDAIGAEAITSLEKQAHASRRRGGELLVSLPSAVDIDEYLAQARGVGAKVIAVVPQRETLEDVFIREAGATRGTNG
jgi:ABC-2 type transport system ATP-binding protein